MDDDEGDPVQLAAEYRVRLNDLARYRRYLRFMALFSIAFNIGSIIVLLWVLLH